ncbi:MAG TPA: hypothetical protein VM529_07725 [Gemmata sp.]|nr:hypothetical protein [Gemmata sp.]
MRRERRGRAARGWMVVLVATGAVLGLGADRPGAWRDAVASLPPVTLAPDAPVAAVRPQKSAVVPAAARVPEPPHAAAATTAVRPAPLPQPTPLPPAAEVYPQTPRVYAINGLNFLGQSGFSEMVDRIRGAGYSDTRSAHWFQAYRLERDIRRLHREQPGTPVVVIGYSLGAYRARAVANRLTRDGIPVAMVGYVGGDYLRDTPSSTPPGACVVNVTGNGFLLSGRNLLFRGTDLSGADNRRLDVSHLDLPKQQQTTQALLNGLAATTGGGYPATGYPAAGVAARPAAAAMPAYPYSYSAAAIAGTPVSAQPPRDDVWLVPAPDGVSARR